MRQHLLNIVDIIYRSGAWIVLKARLYTLTTDSGANLLHKLGICVVAWTSSPYTTLNSHAEKGEITEQIEKFMASKLIICAKLKVVQITACYANILLAENTLKVV